MIVRLQWNRNMESDVSGYNVYRSLIAGGPYAKINAVLIPQSVAGPINYSDTTPTESVFFYVVRAVNAAGLESGNSNEAVANPPVTTPPSAPTGLTATVQVTATLAVDSSQVASIKGDSPLAFNYTLKKTTPPRDRLLTVRVAV